MSEDTTWDESARPTLAEPADASYTAVQLSTVEHLVAIHDHLRGELDRLRDLVDQVRRGLMTVGEARSSVNAMTVRQNNRTLGAYCQSYCGLVDGHHGLEDASVFPHLRRSEAAVGPVRVGDVASLEAVEEAIDALAERLLSHLSYEECELRGPLARHGFY